MIVAVKVNKCSITSLAIKQLNKLFWGYQCKDNQNSVLENYIQYLSCPTVKLITCYPDNCSNPTIINNCNIVLSAISFSVVGDTITFFIDPPDLVGAVAPITYIWGFDAVDFDLVGNITSATLVLTVKPDKDITTLVSPIEVNIVDTNNCLASVLCFFAAGVMGCDDYIPCPNTNNLQVTSDPIPFFTLNASELEDVNTTGIEITSTDSFLVDWGDGTVDSFAVGTRHPIHTYDTPYSGYIKVSTTDLTNITNLGIAGNPLFIVSGGSEVGITVKTSELNKLDGLVGLSISGSNTYLDGIVTDLPDSLINMGVTTTNLSGTTAQFPDNMDRISITGDNTISGNVSGFPSTLTYLLLYGFNTISGNISGLPSGLTSLLIHGSNTLSGNAIGLPSNLTELEIIGSNTIGGDIAGLPSSLVYIVMQGNNTLFGNLVNMPDAPHVTILGVNTITGVLSDISASSIFFQITGHNTIGGDIALLPAGITYIVIDSLFSTINAYTAGIRTWNSTMSAVKFLPGAGGLLTDDVDNLLVELEEQVPTWTADKRIDILGGSQSRSAASDIAVTNLEGIGVTINTI